MDLVIGSKTETLNWKLKSKIFISWKDSIENCSAENFYVRVYVRMFIDRREKHLYILLSDMLAVIAFLLPWSN